MSEFCAGVKILLERMKSNPEDFEEIDRDLIRGIHVRGRFYEFAGSMERMILGTKVHRGETGITSPRKSAKP
jgi:hypothetical protein